jgi:hypothetical protein
LRTIGRRRWAIFAPAAASAFLHGFELLLLLIVENRFDLAL